APKIQKNVKALKLDGWEFIDQVIEYVKKKGANASAGHGGKKFTDPWAKEAEAERGAIEPSPKYLMDLIAGRPVFAYPSRKGGWRLRYGRARTGGLATTAIHPASMALVDDFLAPGTQMKIERPGKATAVTPCDSIDVPLALLANGNLIEVRTYRQAKAIRPMLRQVVDLGEMLVPYGEFAENNKTLPQSPWCDEWWAMVVEKATGKAPVVPATAAEAFEFAARTGTPLSPKYNLFWHDISVESIQRIARFVEAHGRWEPVASTAAPDISAHPEAFTLALPRALAESEGIKELLLEIGALHECDLQTIRLGRHAYAVVRCCGLDVVDGKLARARPLDVPAEAACRYVSQLSGVHVRPRAMFRIGTRMGRPEKAAERKMSPPVHLLFPIGIAGGSQRLMTDAVKVNKIEIEIGERRCPKCHKSMVTYRCEECGEHTAAVPPKGRMEARSLELQPLWSAALERLRMDAPEQVKGVQGLVSAGKYPEPMEKGILRAKHGMFTFKDATVRYDMINVTLTHFKPREAHVSVAKLHELGYLNDIKGEPLTRDDQTLELRVQDIIVATGCLDYMLKASQYVDELLVKLYGFKPFYNCKTRDDMLGHLFVALAPHTSGGVLCRIIGHTKAQAHYGHPYFHAAKRRNCDGDEDCVMLLLDGLLNFSRSYLPSNRGGLMDAPLTLTMRLDPSEVDKEAHNVDVGSSYPLEFYEATLKHPGPKDVEKMVDMVAKRLGKPSQYEGFGFTHDTHDIAEGPPLSAYKTIGSMMDKMTAQLELAARIRAVDAPDVASRVIGSHFLPDMMGNLKAFSKQSMRCTKCNTKFRRVPLTGKCRKCGNPTLTMTVHEGSVKKYLEVSKEVSVRFELDDYTKQRIEHVSDSIDSIFTNDRVKKAKLSDFF
ncbi:MAG TPA: DNA polymerase II large subunit, partial [Candidatus Thermoplasmatota archaeon]|nr:DNA polymerase II large subunit [Candidatus Thermoplasmatota archaeon]